MKPGAGAYFAIAPATYMIMTLPSGLAVDRVKSKRRLFGVGLLCHGATFLFLMPEFGAGPIAIAVMMALNGLTGPFALVPALPAMVPAITQI